MEKENKTTVHKIKVEYETFVDNKVNSIFDRQMEKLANEYGLEFVGSGYNLKTGVRDLSFKGIID